MPSSLARGPRFKRILVTQVVEFFKDSYLILPKFHGVNDAAKVTALPAGSLFYNTATNKLNLRTAGGTEVVTSA